MLDLNAHDMTLEMALRSAIADNDADRFAALLEPHPTSEALRALLGLTSGFVR